MEPAIRGHPCDTRKVAFQGRWLLIGGSFVYKMPFWGMAKWPPIRGWLLIAGSTVLHTGSFVVVRFVY